MKHKKGLNPAEVERIRQSLKTEWARQRKEAEAPMLIEGGWPTEIRQRVDALRREKNNLSPPQQFLQWGSHMPRNVSDSITSRMHSRRDMLYCGSADRIARLSPKTKNDVGENTRNRTVQWPFPTQQSRLSSPFDELFAETTTAEQDNLSDREPTDSEGDAIAGRIASDFLNDLDPAESRGRAGRGTYSLLTDEFGRYCFGGKLDDFSLEAICLEEFTAEFDRNFFAGRAIVEFDVEYGKLGAKEFELNYADEAKRDFDAAFEEIFAESYRTHHGTELSVETKAAFYAEHKAELQADFVAKRRVKHRNKHLREYKANRFVNHKANHFANRATRHLADYKKNSCRNRSDQCRSELAALEQLKDADIYIGDPFILRLRSENSEVAVERLDCIFPENFHYDIWQVIDEMLHTLMVAGHENYCAKKEKRYFLENTRWVLDQDPDFRAATEAIPEDAEHRRIQRHFKSLEIAKIDAKIEASRKKAGRLQAPEIGGQKLEDDPVGLAILRLRELRRKNPAYKNFLRDDNIGYMLQAFQRITRRRRFQTEVTAQNDKADTIEKRANRAKTKHAEHETQRLVLKEAKAKLRQSPEATTIRRLFIRLFEGSFNTGTTSIEAARRAREKMAETCSKPTDLIDEVVRLVLDDFEKYAAIAIYDDDHTESEADLIALEKLVESVSEQ